MNILTPGTSGLLSPFSKINGLYFNDDNEPEDFMYNFKKEVKDAIENMGVEYIDVNSDTSEEYYSKLNELDNYSKENVSTSGKGKNRYIINIDEDDMDNNNDEN